MNTKTRPPCSVDGCDRPHAARGYCQMHWKRWRNHGDPAKVLRRRGSEQPTSCTVQGCDKPNDAAGLCWMHDARKRRHGDVSAVLSNEGRFKGEHATYRTAHNWLTAEFGPASWCRCADCGEQAREWSYDGTDPDEHTVTLRRNAHEWTAAYSMDLDRYTPRCKPCHSTFDKARKVGA